jgi:hypothetical protein
MLDHSTGGYLLGDRPGRLTDEGKLPLAVGPPAGLITPPQPASQMHSAGRFRKGPLH